MTPKFSNQIKLGSFKWVWSFSRAAQEMTEIVLLHGTEHVKHGLWFDCSRDGIENAAPEESVLSYLTLDYLSKLCKDFASGAIHGLKNLIPLCFSNVTAWLSNFYDSGRPGQLLSLGRTSEKARVVFDMEGRS